MPLDHTELIHSLADSVMLGSRCNVISQIPTTDFGSYVGHTQHNSPVRYHTHSNTSPVPWMGCACPWNDLSPNGCLARPDERNRTHSPLVRFVAYMQRTRLVVIVCGCKDARFREHAIGSSHSGNGRLTAWQIRLNPRVNAPSIGCNCSHIKQC